MIRAAHVIAFAGDAERARAFFRDVLELPSVDGGDGWLIFALPPAEIAVHPGEGWGEGEGGHRLFLICEDIEATVEELRAKGVEFTAGVADEGWGLVTTMVVPGHGEVGLYEPRHPSPLEDVGT
jgi:catechol 2,3-dioxygenase-like lactoylglutathione lyase family enzyme